ncbi:MAG: diacylglycerol kinase [Nitrospirae bacterium]|nr:diacylglycerol kinase [Nitrospirota bacterium]
MKKWINSANNAIEGILIAAKTQRHLKIHLYVAASVIFFSYATGVTRIEFLVISLASLFVIMAEMVNTAIEATVDLLSPEYREKARIAKDVAAGAVLTTAIGALIIGYIVLFPYLVNYFEHGFRIHTHAGNEIALLSLIIVIILVVIIKSLTGKGHPLRGGMPSGHTALSFSIWMSITLITRNFVASIFSFAIALLIARSRVAVKVHTMTEVLLGALLGAGVTYLLFKVFS